MIRNKTASGLATVLLFGLISCTNQRNSTPSNEAPPSTPPPATIEDTWRVQSAKVKVDRIDGTGQSSPMQESENPPVPIDAKIVFALTPSPMKTEAPAETVFQITSKCSLGNERSQVSFIGSYQEIEVQSLIPSSFLRQLDFNRLPSLTCDWHFIAENSIGSTHEFKAIGVRIADLWRLETLQVKDRSLDSAKLNGDGRLPDFTFEAEQTSRLEIIENRPLQLEHYLVAELICETFKNRRIAGGQTSLVDLMKELVNGPLRNESEPSVASSNIDPRLLFNEHTCRLIVQTTDPITHFTTTSLSAKLQIRFLPPRPTITREVLLGSFSFSNYKTHPVYQIQIHNPHPVPLAFSFTNQPSRRIHLQPCYMIPNGQKWAKNTTFEEDVDVTIHGAATSAFDSESVLIEIPPGKTATIRAELRSSMETVVWYDSSFESLARRSHSSFIGFMYHFQGPLRLNQLRNWNPRRGSNESITLDIFPESEKKGVLGWMPHRTWIQFSGHESPPSPLRYAEGELPYEPIFLPPGSLADKLNGRPYRAF